MSTSKGVAVRLEACAKTFADGTRALEPMTLDIAGGETMVFLGPSGCGKTTTLRIIAGLERPDAGGRVLFNGEDVTHIPIERRNVGMVFQSYALFPNMTVAENIGVVPRLLGWEAPRIRRRAEELLAMMALEPAQFLDRYPNELSGGQAQRVGVARALAADPPVLLMDEPFGAVDPVNREVIQDEFLRMQKSLRKTVLFVSHDIDEP
jgi:osmoprotectant transport system ATP-binding protein